MSGYHLNKIFYFIDVSTLDKGPKNFLCVIDFTFQTLIGHLKRFPYQKQGLISLIMFYRGAAQKKRFRQLFLNLFCVVNVVINFLIELLIADIGSKAALYGDIDTKDDLWIYCDIVTHIRKD